VITTGHQRCDKDRDDSRKTKAVKMQLTYRFFAEILIHLRIIKEEVAKSQQLLALIQEMNQSHT